MDKFASDAIELAFNKKINSNNAFDINIDYLDNISQIMNQHSGDNWQVASNGLAAFAQVYSYRVDSVHAELFKMMGGLHRNDKTSEGDNDDEADSKNEELKRRRAKNIEENKAKLDLKKFDLDNQVDPLFKHTTAKFSQINAKGLLNYCLEIDNKLDLIIEGKNTNSEENIKLTELTIDNISKMNQLSSEKVKIKNEIENEERAIDEIDMLRVTEEPANTFLSNNYFDKLVDSLQSIGDELNTLDLCFSLNDIKRKIIEKSGNQFKNSNSKKKNDYTPNKEDYIDDLYADDYLLMTKLDNKYSSNLLHSSDQLNSIRKKQSIDNYDNESIHDYYDNPVQDEDNISDISISSKENDSIKSKSSENIFDKNMPLNINNLDYQNKNRRSVITNSIESKDIQLQMQKFGQGQNEIFNSLKNRKLDVKLNWEKEKQIKIDDVKREEKRQKVSKLFAFEDENEVKDELFINKSNAIKKVKLASKKIKSKNKKKNKKYFNFIQNICFTLFSNKYTLLNNHSGFDEFEEVQIKKQISLENQEEQGNIYEDDEFELGQYENQSGDESLIIQNNAKMINFDSENKNDSRAKLQQIYKIVNVRKVKSQIMQKLDTLQNNQDQDRKKSARKINEKTIDFINLVNTINTDNSSNNQQTYNSATCFVSLLHLCNEKSKLI